MANLEEIRQLNNTYNETCVRYAIENIQMGNYHYLAQLQKDLIDHTRFDFLAGDIKRIIRTQYSVIKGNYGIKILKEFITPSLKSTFKRSKFYNKVVSIFDIESHSEFQYSCLVFIDGTLYTGVGIYPTDEFTFIIFEDEIAKELMSRPNIKITVIICPNFKIMSEETNLYRLEQALVRKERENWYTVKNNRYQFLHTFTQDNRYSDIVLTSRTRGQLTLATTLTENYRGKTFYRHSIGLQYLTGSVVLSNQTYFSIPEYNMPVISDAMLIFKRTDGGLIFDHEATIEAFYPNIYRLNCSDYTQDYYILFFYYGDTDFDIYNKLVYENRFNLLKRINFNLLEGYRNNNLPDVVKQYSPEQISYSISDFKASIYATPTDYKDNKLKSLIREESTHSSSYFDLQIKAPKRVYLDVSTIDLSIRERQNTASETPHNKIYFTKPHYVFIIRKNIIEDPYNTRIFIDGMINLFHTITENEYNLYIYIPCEFITDTSFLEFESFKNMVIDKEFQVKNNEAIVELNINDFSISFTDMLVLDEQDNIIDPTDYDIYIKKAGQFINLSDTYRTYLNNTLKIVFTSQGFNNRTLKIKIIHKAFYTTQEIVTEDDRGKAIYFHTPLTRELGHFRIFRNGKLVPNKFYDIKFRKNINSELGIDILIDKQVGDVIVVDIVPFDYREVYSADKIPETGFIDLKEILPRPISLKWYDIYLNGKKLNIHNIDIISPTKFFIQNVDSRRNLYIVETNRDEEYFSIYENWRSYNDDLWDRFPNLEQSILEQHPLLPDNEYDYTEERVLPVSVDLDRFYEYYAKHQTILNPDEVDIPDEIYDQFDSLKSDGVILLNPDMYHGAPSMLEILNFDKE